jgi:2,4-dienoyl-CoA reductase-like NADH-dependent reductase (Old Yellow Enzyme family)
MTKNPVRPEKKDKQMTALDTPFVTEKISLKNRIVLPPLTTNYGSSTGFVTEKIIQFYQERSKDIGLVIVEATAVQENGRIVPDSLGLWDDSQVKSMAELVSSIKKQGAFAVVQLNHAGSRCIPLENEIHGFSPSEISFRADVKPVIMTAADIKQLVDDFGRAAVRAMEAGFDGVEIHGAHFYLLSQFLSPLINKRSDRYGGDIKGRATLAVEIVKTVRDRLGQNYPIFFRLNGAENIEGGQTLEDALVVGKMLADAGVDVLDISLIAHGGWKEIDGQTFLTGSSALTKKQPSGANVDLTAVFKKEIGLPVIAVGKLGDKAAALKAINDKDIDLIAVGRQMICDPETARKMLDGNDDDIILCDECLKCFTTIRRGEPMACKVNKNLPF